jgi:predicted amidohydrolase
MITNRPNANGNNTIYTNIIYGDDQKYTFNNYSKLVLPEPSEWKCYLFGGDSTGGISWRPDKGKVPNAFVRWMMKVCFGCTWVKEK